IGLSGAGLQCAASVQSAALVQTVPIHLVKQRAQAYSQPLRGLPPVAARRREGRADRLALRGLDGVAERDLTPSLPLSTLWRGGGGVRPEVHRLQDLLIREHRRALDRMLELASVPRPALLDQPRHGCLAQGERMPEAAGLLQREV